MARKSRRKSTESERPSLFFLIALIVGLILLVWLFIRSTGKEPAPPPLESRAACAEGRGETIEARG